MSVIIKYGRQAISSIAGRIYSFLYEFDEVFESRFGLYFAFGELVLVLSGLLAAMADVRLRLASLPAVPWIDLWSEHWRDPFEALIFLCLSVLTLGRLATALRRRYLGYIFPASDHSDKLFFKVMSVPFGDPPLHLANTPASRRALVEAIARQTAVLLSLRSFLNRDRRWMQRERERLDRWFSACPDSLWRIPIPGAERSSAPSGYLSVILPITDGSWWDIRKGMLPTDMAEIDHEALRSGTSTSKATIDKQLKFLAYLQIFCAERNESVLDKDLLAASSFQHIAHLLHKIYGVEGDFTQNWHFAIMCESANRTMDGFLTGLGFCAVQERVMETSRASTLPARSFADFKLFEFEAFRGQACGAGDRVDANQFLELLQDLVRVYEKRSEPIAG
jgi:hypothetical protein